MTTQAARGFTIIEVMLFLAITGALTIGILGGSSTAIAQQRYRDSVNSLKGLIQDQYSQTMNVRGSAGRSPVCRKVGSSLTLDTGTLQARGTSDCLLIGRYVLIEPTKLTAYDVIGQPNTASGGGDDVAVLKDYLLRLSDTPEVRDVAWGARIVRPNTTTGLTASLLILRSPLSGSVLTFVRDGNQTPVSMVDASYMTQKDLCVDAAGGQATSQRLAVRINAKATGQSSIEIPLEGSNACGQ